MGQESDVTTGNRLASSAVDEARRPSDAILRALDGSGVDLHAVTEPLGYRIDLDAVDDVLDGPGDDVRLRFRAYDRVVVVDEEEASVYADPDAETVPGRQPSAVRTD